MNLQLCLPYQKCVFNCPFCIAKDRKHNYEFDNLYADNRNLYLSRLIEFIKSHKIKDVIITGECDPIQDLEFIAVVSRAIIGYIGGGIEIQTKSTHISMYASQLRDTITTIAHSISSVRELERYRNLTMQKPFIHRATILLTKEFNAKTLDYKVLDKFDQITFKVLQYGESERINRWIDRNKLQDLLDIEQVMEHYNGTSISVRLDRNCQDSVNRYYIFRADGNVYEKLGKERTYERTKKRFLCCRQR